MNKNLFLKCMIFVAAVHIGLIGWAVFLGQNSENFIKPQMQKLVARTVSCCEEKPIEKQKTAIAMAETKQPPVSPPVPKKDPPKPKPTPLPAKKESSIKKMENPKPKVTPIETSKKDTKPATPTESSKKNDKLKDSLANIQSHLNDTKSLKKSKTELAELKGLPDLNIDNIYSSGIEAGYYAGLVSCLKENLILPEIGEVKVRLHVLREGTINKVEILQSKSKVNKEWLEKKLPSLKLPAFGNYFKDTQMKEFVITLTNAHSSF